MKLQTKIETRNTTVFATVGAPDSNAGTFLNEAERAGLRVQGEVEVEVGGELNDDVTLPDATRLFPSQFPVKMQWTASDDLSLADARVIALLWIALMTTRMDTVAENLVGTASAHPDVLNVVTLPTA